MIRTPEALSFYNKFSNLIRGREHIEVFEHRDKETGQIRYFNITYMNRIAAFYLNCGLARMVISPMDGKYMEFIQAGGRGIEEDHFGRITKNRLEVPVLGVMLRGGEIDQPELKVLQVDGHHRLLMKHLRGDIDYSMVVFHPSTLDDFLLDEDLGRSICEDNIRH